MTLPNYYRKKTTEAKEKEKFVDVTPQEQKMFDEIDQLTKLLENYPIKIYY